ARAAARLGVDKNHPSLLVLVGVLVVGIAFFVPEPFAPTVLPRFTLGLTNLVREHSEEFLRVSDDVDFRHHLILSSSAVFPRDNTSELTSSPSGIGMILAFGSEVATLWPNSSPGLSPSVSTNTVRYPKNGSANHGCHDVAPGTPTAGIPHT